jgi:hypothetical protein
MDPSGTVSLLVSSLTPARNRRGRPLASISSTGHINNRREQALYALVHQKPPFPLTTQDRCDRCSAQAVVQTMLLSGGLLLWCSHHFGRNKAALDASAARVVSDERDNGGEPT